MTNWFETTAKYRGTEGDVTDKFLVSAVSVADAEKRTFEYLDQYAAAVDAPDVTCAAARKVSEVFRYTDVDNMTELYRWYRCKVMFISVDPKSGKEKRTPAIMMVYGEDVEDAIKSLKIGMRGTLSDWELHTVAETAIVDVIMESDGGEAQ